MPVPLAIAAGAAFGVATLGAGIGVAVWAARKGSRLLSTSLRGTAMPQPKPVSAMSALQPRFRTVLEAVLSDLRAQGYRPKVFETLRSAERQAWLFHNTTSTRTPVVGKHGQGLAADIIDGRSHPTRPGQIIGWGTWRERSDATQGDDVAAALAEDFFQALGRAAQARGLVWGGAWSSIRDLPHVEYGASAGVA